jgi:hypothetical protein
MSKETSGCEVRKVLIQAFQQANKFGLDEWRSFSWQRDGVSMRTPTDNKDLRATVPILF